MQLKVNDIVKLKSKKYLGELHSWSERKWYRVTATDGECVTSLNHISCCLCFERFVKNNSKKPTKNP